MIKFRCWYCHRQFSKKDSAVGNRFVCTCKSKIKVPSRSEGNCRDRSIGEWCIEAAIYGPAGALFGFVLGVMSVRFIGIRGGLASMIIFTLAGFLGGTFGGENFINWVGRKIREREDNAGD